MTTERTAVTNNAIEYYEKTSLQTAMEALRSRNMDYTVVKKRLFIEGSSTPVDNAYALSRVGGDDYFGVCTDRYKIVQNHEVAEIVDSLPIEGANLVTMGSRNNSLMLTAKMNTVSIGTSDDVNNTYINFMWGHDGKSSVTCFPSSVRIMCQNAGPAMISNAKDHNQLTTFRHMGDVESKMSAAREAMAMYTEAETRYLKAAGYLAGCQINEVKAYTYYSVVANRLFGAPSDENEERRIQSLKDIWYNTAIDESEVLSTPLNGWLAFNSVTKSLQRMVPVRGKQISVSNKINSLFTGKDNQQTNIAFNTALASF